MKHRYSFRQIAGNFAVEFAIVGIFFSLLLVFSGDIIIKLSLKGKLERLSFSMASVVKERKELFGDDYTVTQADINNIYNISVASMERTYGAFDQNKYGFNLTVYTLDNGGNLDIKISRDVAHGSVRCAVPTPDTSLFVTTSWGRSLTLYQVSMCYASPNWFGSLVGRNFSRVGVYSAVMGR